jgi:hypothetical protein
MGIRTRLIAAAMAAAAATVTAVGGAATASAAPASPTAAAPKLSGDNGKPKPGKDKDKEQGVPAEAVKLLAAELHISAERSRQVFRDLDKVKARGEDIVKDPAFVAIAKGLRITPQQLLDTLRKVKQKLGDKPKDKPKDKVESGAPVA